MMDLGSGIALGSLCIGASAVAITAIRARTKSNGKGCYPCKEHSGVMQCLESIEKTQDRQEKWLGEIAGDMKTLLRKV